MLLTRRFFLQASAASAIVPKSSLAQSYPSGPVRIIVGFPPGGPLDIAARTIAPWLAGRLGQQVEVVNKPGASGNLATAEVAAASPDGRTLLLCGPVHVINTMLFRDLPFDFGRDIEPIGALAQVPLVIEVPPALGVGSLAELVDRARANPGKLKVAYAGNGTPQHVAIELFKTMTDVDLALVSYLGSAPALADLLAGKVDVMFDPLPSSLEHVRSGRLRALATTGLTRSSALRDVPAAAETIPGFEGGSWFGLGGPRGMSAEHVSKLNEAIREGLKDPGVQAQFERLGARTMPGSPEDFERFIASETTRYGEVVRRANIQL